jgi:hypothetical protein
MVEGVAMVWLPSWRSKVSMASTISFQELGKVSLLSRRGLTGSARGAFAVCSRDGGSVTVSCA